MFTKIISCSSLKHRNLAWGWFDLQGSLNGLWIIKRKRILKTYLTSYRQLLYQMIWTGRWVLSLREGILDDLAFSTSTYDWPLSVTRHIKIAYSDRETIDRSIVSVDVPGQHARGFIGRENIFSLKKIVDQTRSYLLIDVPIYVYLDFAMNRRASNEYTSDSRLSTISGVMPTLLTRTRISTQHYK